MLVSIIVPTRNRPLELKRALGAIGQQTYPNVDIIVVDDGSTPEHARANNQLVERMGARASYIFLSPSFGPAHARNAGIRQAKGDLIAFCDDDDYWCDERHVEAAVRAFEADPSLDLTFANQHAHANGALVRSVWLPALVKKLSSHPDFSQANTRVSVRDCLLDDFGHMNTCIFRRELLRGIGGFWEAVRYLEDMDLFVRAVDSARHIEYRHQTVSVHNVPDRAVQANASTLFDTDAREMMAIMVANHLLQRCRSKEARRYAYRVGGYAYRHLAVAAAASKRPGSAFGLARLGLIWLPTFRWAMYTAYLGFRAIANARKNA